MLVEVRSWHVALASANCLFSYSHRGSLGPHHEWGVVGNGGGPAPDVDVFPVPGGEAVSELLNYTNLLGAVVGCGSLHSPAAQRLSVNHHGAMEERAGSRAVPLARCRRSSSWEGPCERIEDSCVGTPCEE